MPTRISVRRRAALLTAVVPACLLALGLLGLDGVLTAARSDEVPDAGPGRPLVGAHNDTTTPFNLVDLPALFDHPADGANFQVLGATETRRSFVRYAISFASDGLRESGTLLLPRRPGKAPLVVVAHGWHDAATYERGSGLLREEDALARAGFAVLHPDYRNYAGSERESGAPVAEPVGYPSDVINAIVAFRAAAPGRVDLTRMSLLGRSMGGGVALQVAEAHRDWFRSMLLYSPVSSDAADDYERFALTAPGLADRLRPAYGSPATRPKLWREASSRTYLHRVAGERPLPVQIDHGTDDPIAPYAWSTATAHALADVGGDVQLIPYVGEGHRFDQQWPRFRDSMLEFFDRTLR